MESPHKGKTGLRRGDHTSLADHMLAKRAKDIGSSAVLLSLANVVAVWMVVLLD